MGASNIYGLTPKSVLDSLGYTDIQVASPSAEATEEAIQEFAGRVNSRLKGLGLTPKDITASGYPDLYQDIRSHLKSRVKAWWHAANQRNPTLEERAEEEFAIWIRLLREAPTHMVGDASHELRLKSDIYDPAPGRRAWVSKEDGFS